jgi:manganese/zinc/iron transport system substrate-binding protein
MACLLALLGALFTAGCSNQTDSTRRIRVTATVTMLTDLVRQIGGDRVDVQGLMGPGVDPHLYKATQADLARLRQADLVFYCGLLLEGKMQDALENLGRGGKPVYAVAQAIPRSSLIEPPNASGHFDPHVWFEVPLWSTCVDPVVEGLSAVDPAGKAYFEKRAVEYKGRLKTLHEWALQRASELPPEKRILVTSHDAFAYFGRAYGFQVVALQGISTVSEPSLADIVQMVEFVKQHQVKAIFVESSVPHRTIQRVSEDAGVQIGGELFSDATGTPGQIEDGHDLGTYEGMFRHNMNAIINALK